jgi:hypothetical protein
LPDAAMLQKNTTFFYKGKERSAHVIISLHNDLKVVFASLTDPDLAEKFGDDVDFQTDMHGVIQTNIYNKELFELQTSILEAIKSTEDFIKQRARLQSSGREANHP